MHAPRAVHACTFFNDDVYLGFFNVDVDDDVDYYPLRFARPP